MCSSWNGRVGCRSKKESKRSKVVAFKSKRTLKLFNLWNFRSNRKFYSIWLESHSPSTGEYKNHDGEVNLKNIHVPHTQNQGGESYPIIDSLNHIRKKGANNVLWYINTRELHIFWGKQDRSAYLLPGSLRISVVSSGCTRSRRYRIYPISPFLCSQPVPLRSICW